MIFVKSCAFIKDIQRMYGTLLIEDKIVFFFVCFGDGLSDCWTCTIFTQKIINNNDNKEIVEFVGSSMASKTSVSMLLLSFLKVHWLPGSYLNFCNSL